LTWIHRLITSSVSALRNVVFSDQNSHSFFSGCSIGAIIQRLLIGLTAIEPAFAPVGIHNAAKAFASGRLDLLNPSGYHRAYFQVGWRPPFLSLSPDDFPLGINRRSYLRSLKLRLDPRISEIIERVTAREGMEFVHAEMTGGKNPILRVYIDKPGGVTLDDCVTVSESVSLILDVEDIIPHQYTLEVASPGLDRGLYKEADYERFAGLPARVRISEAINGQKNFHGKLIGLDREGEVAAVIEEPDGQRRRLPLAKIVKANVEIEP
jgi:ribosome maturation factor RimP